MKIGYIRVSKDEQSTSLQEDAMEKEGCDKVFLDKMTGSRFDRPEFQRMLGYARPGDVIVVWKLDRLGRSLQHLIETVKDLEVRGIELRILTGALDTTTPGGKLMFHIFGAIAEFERDITIERTHAGLDAARARGCVGGRKSAIEKIGVRNIARAKELHAEKRLLVKEIMKMCGFKSKTTYYKYVVNG